MGQFLFRKLSFYRELPGNKLCVTCSGCLRGDPEDVKED